MALVHHLDRGSPDILSLTLFHLSPFFSPAEQLLDPSCGGASEKQSMQSNAHEKSMHNNFKTHYNSTAAQHNISPGWSNFHKLKQFYRFFKRN